ncbi:MAG: TolC family protein [Leadbetterella sp.]|nr:TolC family protein [Leadbetterella sp.]
MRIILLIWLVYLSVSAQAQTKLSLVEVWQKALQNPQIQVKISETEQAKIDLSISERLLLPNISGQYNNTFNVGRSIDPFTNAFLTQSILGNNYGLSANYTVFDNRQIKNQIAANELYVKVLGQAQKITENDIKYQTLLAFSEVLLAEEQIKTAQALVNAAKENLAYYKKLYAADRIRYSALLSLQADELRLQTNLAQAIAAKKQAKLKLNRLIGESSEQEIIPVDKGINLSIKPYAYSIDKLVEEATMNLPDFENLKLQKLIKAKESEIIMAQKWPTVLAFSNVGTTYSSAARSVENQELVKINYPNQFGQNLNMNIGLSVRFPIFNTSNYQQKRQKNKVELKNLNLQTEIKKLEIRGMIEDTYTQLHALLKRESLMKERLAVLETLEKINKKGFEEGRVEFSEYLQTKETWSRHNYKQTP